METINSMASTAAKAIWGDNNNNTSENTNETNKTGTETMSNETKGTEPVSGKLGDTSAGEPFDAGNIESGATKTSTSTAPSTAQTGSESTSSGLPTTTSTDATPAGSKDSTGGPTSDHPSATGDTGFKAPQADIRDPDSSTADPKKEAERKNVDNTGGLDTSENPTKVEGAGPKPIEEVAKSHGGDAGSASKESSGAGGADEDGPGAKSKSEGTGEQYVKSSGLAADGGDFDATKPGAGREADRLLEEKGMTTQTAAAAASGKKTEEDKSDKSEKSTPDSPDSKKEKASLKDKIKAKLHKN